MFDVKLAVFKMRLLGYWSKEGVLYYVFRSDTCVPHVILPWHIECTAVSSGRLPDVGMMCTLRAAGDYEVIADDDDDDSELEEDAGDVAAVEEDEEAEGQNSKRRRQ